MGNYDNISLEDGSPLTNQEKWVLEQVKLGEIADLKNQFGVDEANRLLRAKFIEEILTDGFQGFTPHRRGIRIAQAVIAEPLDLENAEVGHIVALYGCIFKQAVNLVVSIFTRLLILNGTEFRGSVNFLGADIRGLFKAEWAQFQGRVNLNGLKVGQSAFFDGTVFQGPVDSGGADVGGRFTFNGAKFQGEGQENQANFNGIKVGHDAYFDNAIFQGPVDFRGADISGQFGARAARFEGQGEENRAKFGSIRVGQSAFFDGAVFQGMVDFRAADIIGQFSAEGAQFRGRGQENQAIFNGIKVRLSAFFNNAMFQGPVDFRGAEIDEEFHAKGARFEGQGEENQVRFKGLKVSKHAYLDGVIFQAPVDFTLAHVSRRLSLEETTFYGPAIFCGVYVGGQFSAHQAQFKSKGGTNFEGLKVALDAFFCCTEFGGPVDLNNAHLLDLRICGNTIVELNLNSTRIDRELRIGKTEIGTLTAKNLAVNGSAILEDMNFTEAIDLRDASFQSLEIVQVKWPPKSQKVWLEGLTYKSISAGQHYEDWRKILAWIEGARFNTQPYSQLETYSKSCGHKERADAVFFAMKKQEENIAPDLWPMFKNVFLRWTVGYGRRPWRALAWSALCVCFGIWLFWNRGDMTIRKGPENTITLSGPESKKVKVPNYDPLMYSLDLFLPIDLSVAKQWEPNPEWRLGWYYSKIQVMLGWILITILLAALTGIIK